MVKHGRLLVATLLVACCVSTLAWNAENFPNPMADPSSCNRGDVLGWVCDPDRLISTDDLNILEGHVRAIYNGKEPYHHDMCRASLSFEKLVGWQVAVAVLNRVDGNGNSAEKVEQFAQRLHTRLGVGNRDCGSGVLLVVSLMDRQVYISSGRDALQQLTAARVSHIIKHMAPKLRSGDTAGALKGAVIEIGLILSGDVPPEDATNDTPPSWVFGGLFAAVMGVFGVSHCRARRQRNNFQAANNKLLQMQRDLKEANAGRYVSTTCPICLDDFEVKTAPSQPPSPSPTDTKKQSSEKDHLLQDPVPSAPPLPTDEDCTIPNPVTSTGRTPPPPKVPFLLPCGHTFCQPCILEWLKNHDACPVCRKPTSGVDESGAGPSTGSQPRPPSNPSDTDARNHGNSFGVPHYPAFGDNGMRGCQYNDRPYLGWDMYGPEFAFRMNSMRYMYPDIITDGMVDDMNQQVITRGEFNFQQHADFQARDPEVQAARAREGASSSGANNFGGGASAGGHGGSW